MNIIIIFLILIIFICISYIIYQKNEIHTVNEIIDERNKIIDKENIQLIEQHERILKTCKDVYNLNKTLEEENIRLEKEKDSHKEELRNIKKDIDYNNQSIKDKQNQLKELQQIIKTTEETQEELSRAAFKNYFKILGEEYKKTEEEYRGYTDILKESYSNLQLKLMREADECRADLDKIRASRAATIEAQRKEKEISEQQSFYCLQVSDNEMKDIAVLESIKPKLNNQRIMSMLIWQTFFRSSMTKLCNDVLGRTTKTGIYKITNQLTKECYIGQAVDLASRWKDHAKCGLGVDTPAENKLYKAMQEYGIWNFSWELLEECPRDQLNEKEQFYIELYQAKQYGYNKTIGIKEK